MDSGERAYLDPTSWFESLARLSEWAAIGAPIENSLRIAHHLARLTPPPFAQLAPGVPDEEEFEALLERAAFEAAAVALIGTALSHEALAPGGGEGAAARVWREGAGDEACAQAETLALALVRAWLAFMLAQAPRDPGQPAGSSHKSA